MLVDSMLNGRQRLVNRSLLRSVHGANLNPFADGRKCRPPMKKPRRCRRGFQVRVRRYYFAAAVSSPAGALLGALLLCELLLCECCSCVSCGASCVRAAAVGRRGGRGRGRFVSGESRGSNHGEGDGGDEDLEHRFSLQWNE